MVSQMPRSTKRSGVHSKYPDHHNVLCQTSVKTERINYADVRALFEVLFAPRIGLDRDGIDSPAVCFSFRAIVDSNGALCVARSRYVLNE